MKINLIPKVIPIFMLFVSSCSFAPGMHMTTDSTWLDDNQTVYIESIDKDIPIININNSFKANQSNTYKYEIGTGDQIAITVWGLQDIFPLSGINTELNLRRVDENGNIFFPYAGLVKASGKTQDELRQDITDSLSEYFNDPQIDVSIAKFNSKQIFILGEVTKPSKINLTDTPVSLSEAIGESLGLNSITAAGSEVYVIRQSSPLEEPAIFYADLKSPSSFLEAGNFFLIDNDIIYVNASGTARWNKVVSQFFPFSTFLNSIDNLSNSD